MVNNDAKLLGELHKGNVAAYKQVFNEHYKPLVLKSYLMLNDLMEAEDAVQKLFIDLWEKRQWSQIHTSLTSYLRTACHNRCLKLIEKRKTEAKRRELYFIHDTDASFAEENYAEIEGLMREMPGQRLQTLNLVYLHNKKYQEAADEMGISINSVKTHLKLAVKFLKSRIKKH